MKTIFSDIVTCTGKSLESTKGLRELVGELSMFRVYNGGSGK